MANSPRVLSIQSHVVSGYVGNKSATFPLQLLGFEVDAINSVQFSNHTGYKVFKGQVLTDKDLDDLISGLISNGLDNYTHLLTGYIGSASFLNRVANLVKHLKTVNPDLIYVCDPVMGDNGEFYVPEELQTIYKETVVSLADIITPNQFEAELLTGLKINSLDDAWEAIAILHSRGCKTVALSSTELGDEQNLLALASKNTDGENLTCTINFPKYPATFTGTGDLFTSLFLAWSHKTNNNLKETLENTICTLQAVLKQTLKYATECGISSKSLELKLIQSKNIIENPVITLSAIAKSN